MNIANSRLEEEATSQPTRALQASAADDIGFQSAQGPSTLIVPDFDEDLEAIAELLNLPSNEGLPDVAEIPKRRDLAQNCDAANAMDVTLDSVVSPTRPDLEDTLSDSSGTQLTSAKNQRLPKD
jgi:hypothetical protein